MGNIFYTVLAILMTTLFLNNVDQVIPNNVGYYVGMVLPF